MLPMRGARGSTAVRKLGGLIAALAIGVALLLGRPSAAESPAAEPLPVPQGEIILRIDGAITHRNDEDGASFDLAMLQSLPSHVLVTETPWTKGNHTFTGVPLEALMAAVGATGKTVTAYALNDYSVDLPIEDGKKHGALVVYLFDGAPMLPSNRGPLWIVYPFSDRKETRSETYYQRAVWNLDAMTVR
jgi:hypothetical protein